MSAAVQTVLAQAVADALNAAGSVLPFTAVRKNRPLQVLAELTTDLVVFVAPSPREKTGFSSWEPATRGLSQIDTALDVMLMMRCQNTDEALLDQLAIVCDDFKALLLAGVAGGDLTFQGLDVNQPFPFDPDKLDNEGVYQTLLSCIFRTWK